MLELSREEDNWRLGYGGDTLNTAIQLARRGHDVAYLTAVGCDPLSANLKMEWEAEGLDTSLVLIHPTRSSGLYAISNDLNGERSFSYWRDNSAAREMFSLKGIWDAIAAAEYADLIGYSLITLAILPPEARIKLFTLCQRCRARGGRVVFDGNYRPGLWDSVNAAREARMSAIACADIGLPTLEDERLLDGAITANDVAERWKAMGCGETVVKLGSQGAHLPDGKNIPPPEVLQPVDTSGAGDAFNAGYLASRMSGGTIEQAAIEGHRLAGRCVMQSGAIPSRGTPSQYS